MADAAPAVRYDEAGKCLDCGGVGGSHSLDCPPMAAKHAARSAAPGYHCEHGVNLEAGGYCPDCGERDAAPVLDAAKAGRFVLASGENTYHTSWDTWEECEVAFEDGVMPEGFRLEDTETGVIWLSGARYEWVT